MIRTHPKDVVVLTLHACIKANKIFRVYVDGGAQMCMIIERLMNRLKLDMMNPSRFRVSLANNSNIICLGIIENLTIKVCEIQVQVDMYTIQSKRECYPIILGRSWLTVMNPKWGASTLMLRPNESKGESPQRVTYGMRKGKELDLRYETIVDEETSTYSMIELNEEESSSLESLGITFTQQGTSNFEVLNIESNQDLEERLRKMLASDLSLEK